MKSVLLMFSVLLVTVGMHAHASSLDINLRDEAIRMTIRGPVNQTGLNMSLSGLHHENDKDLIAAGVSVVEEMEAGSYVGVGGKLYAFDANSVDGLGIALGGFFRYGLPGIPGLGLGGQLFYGPDVVSFDDVKQYIETELRLEYELLTQAIIYTGYRHITIKMDNNSKGRVDSGLHFGLRLMY
ncbi:MAG: YfaZ family protein [Gammaproteobacteria bacterium]|nr:YfaZ family protein [Gammaproteobacteria bacterium]